MKMLSYNARGLGGGEKRVEVRRLVQEKSPLVLCVQETKLSLVDDLCVKTFWGDAPFGYSYQQSVGASGGLIIVWDSTRLNVWSSMSFDHVLVISGTVMSTGEDVVIINVYAPCDSAAKILLWDQLSSYVLSKKDSCLCVCGDFNSVRSIDERKGKGMVFRKSEANMFNKFIDDSLLIDLPICGRLFTWYRGDGISMSRLDRFLLSEKWCERWPNCIQVALQQGLFDHVPMVLYADESNWGPCPLRMLKCWSEYPGYAEFVRDRWGSFNVQGWGSYVLKQKLKMIKACLKEWHQKRSQNMEGKIIEVKNRIAYFDTKGEVSALLDEEANELHQLSVRLHSMARVQTSINWQKARLNWLQEGDANSKFFHGVMANRLRSNTVNLVNVNGINIEGVQNIRTAVFDHFSRHFKVIRASRPGVEGLSFCKLSCREAGTLIKPFSLEEVRRAVWDCDSYKSLGPDGITFGFVKEFWELLKDDFMRFIVKFHRNGKLLKGVNSTFIALISKVTSPQRLNDFRPISLVGSMYKVLAKVLANRLREVISSVVSESQSAFVKGKQILDGILIANEVVDEAKRLKKELLMFKVDFEKAYDSVDLNYLDSVMANMNFPTLWRKWISECVGTVMASVLVNGSSTEEFSIECGLRQGDPLSPFLFLLAAEGFNIVMEAMVGVNRFTGYRVGSMGEVNLTHLQFADDTLIIGEKSWQNVRSMRAVLLLFEEISGLKGNFHKSMLIGVNISDSWLIEAPRVMNCRTGTIPFFYLGLPIGGDPRKLSFWKPVIDRIVARLSLWNNKFLSCGGRLILLKSVLSSLPVYFLSFFKAPAGIISSIESIFKRFFWGGGEDHRKIAWINWNSVCVPKEDGGLGVWRLG